MEVTLLPPFRQRSPPVMAADERGAGPATAAAPRILIVEDDYLVAVDLEAGLAEAGVSVVGIAATAAEALRLANSERPDLVIMDVRLGGRRDGIAAAIDIYSAAGIRCIFTTAYADPRAQERAAAASPLGWLQKPYQIDALIGLIRASFSAPTQ